MSDFRAELEIACRAFGLFTPDERLAALEKFSTLRYPSVADRFFEAVHHVIQSKERAETGAGVKDA